MSLEGYELAEHAKQLGEITEALIRMEGMKAENRLQKVKGKPPTYIEKDFLDLLDECGLWHNDRVEKARRF